MKLIPLLFATLVLLCVINPSQAQCLHGFSRSDSVEIKVILRFKSTHYDSRWAYELLYPKLKMPNQTQEVYLDEKRITDAGLETVFCVDAEHVREDSTFVMLLGPKTLSIKARPISWETKVVATTGRKLRLGKMSPIHFLSLPDPDWLMLESVRLLRLLKNNTWAIEATIANKSDHPVALQEMEINASHPGPGGPPCAIPDPPQEVNISWNKIISGSEKGVWTKLGDTNVQVKASYSNRGRCSPFLFEASIPIQHTVPAHQVIRVTIRINEMPATIAGPEAPPSLANWRGLWVSFKPEVYPSSVDVER